MPLSPGRVPLAGWLVRRDQARTKLGPNSPVGVSRPFAALPVEANRGAVTKADPEPAAGAGHAWLQLVAALPVPVADDDAGGNSPESDPTCTAWLLAPRRYGRRRRLLRVPQTLLVTGNFTSFSFRRALADGFGPFSERGIDLVVTSGTDQAAWMAPLVAFLPLADARPTVLGYFKNGPGGFDPYGYQSLSARDPAGYHGGRLYVASVEQERMGFGLLERPREGVLFALGGSNRPAVGPDIRYGYVFAAETFWTAGQDPGPQVMPDCAEVGRTEIPDASVLFPFVAGRIQTFLNARRAAEDRATLGRWLPAFDRLRVTFWGDEFHTSGSSVGVADDPALLNPGDPVAVCAALAGGLADAVRYRPLPEDLWAADGDVAAAAILADAATFFGV